MASVVPSFFDTARATATRGSTHFKTIPANLYPYAKYNFIEFQATTSIPFLSPKQSGSSPPMNSLLSPSRMNWIGIYSS